MKVLTNGPSSCRITRVWGRQADQIPNLCGLNFLESSTLSRRPETTSHFQARITQASISPRILQDAQSCFRTRPKLSMCICWTWRSRPLSWATSAHASQRPAWARAESVAPQDQSRSVSLLGLPELSGWQRGRRQRQLVYVASIRHSLCQGQ